MRSLSKIGLLSLGAAFFVAACESTGNPASTGPQTPGISQAVHTNSGGDGVARFENLEVCKTWENPSAVSTDFDVTVGNDANAAGATTTVTRTLVDGECRDWAGFNGSTAPGEPGPATELTIVEDVPTGAELVSITWVAVDPQGNDISGAATGAPYNVSADVNTATWSADFGDNTIGYLITFHNRVIPTGGEGCTPGFWKNHAGIYSHSTGGQKKPSAWETFLPTDFYDTIFGVTSSFGATFRLIDALGEGGGDEAALARHAVAALLNSVHSGVDYDLSASEVIDIVQDAYASGDFEDAKNELAAFNEQGCPL